MRTSQNRAVVRWQVMAASAGPAEAELATLGVSYARSEATMSWPDGDAQIVTYEFTTGAQVGPVFEAVDRLRAAGHWFDGWYFNATSFPA